MTEQEVLTLREEIFADGNVSREEFDTLWAKKSELGDDVTPEFQGLFVDAGVQHLTSDGELDDEEANYLINKINEDDEIDDSEEELLYAIADFKEAGGTVSDILVNEFPEYFE